MDERLERIDQQRAGKARRGCSRKSFPLSAKHFSRTVSKKEWGGGLVRKNKTQRSRAGKAPVTNMLKWKRGIDICSDRSKPPNNQKRSLLPSSQGAAPGPQLRAQDWPGPFG